MTAVRTYRIPEPVVVTIGGAEHRFEAGSCSPADHDEQKALDLATTVLHQRSDAYRSWVKARQAAEEGEDVGPAPQNELVEDVPDPEDEAEPAPKGATDQTASQPAPEGAAGEQLQTPGAPGGEA